MKEGESRLKGHSLLIVESEDFAGHLFAEFYVNKGMKEIITLENIPMEEGLLEFMDRNGLDAALVHATRPDDEKFILRAFGAGKKILVIKRDPPCTHEEEDFYESLEKKGVATLPKRIGTELKKYADCLEELFN